MDVFNLQSSIELDLREFERRLDQAEDDMKKFSKSSSGTFSKIGGLLKDGIVAGAKTAAAGITALATAITGLAVSAAKSYSTFEQLQGGAQKIFDEMDYSKIAKDAENAYKDLNMSANQYLESINLVGAMFAQTMGDEKAYDTARTGMIAISDYASGTGKSIEELNQKYQMITRSTSSYQSIADQFAGILPATSADFLAQAQAAGLLSGEYEKLTEVPIAEYQQALTSMLEKGVNDLGLSQNTLRESTETMTGSIAMAKAAWENLKVAMAGGGDMSTSMEAFSKAVGATIKNILPIFKNAVKGVGTLIKELTPTIAKEAPQIVNTIIGSLVPAVVESMPIVVQGIAEMLPDTLDSIFTAIVSLIPAVVESAKILPTVIQSIVEKLPEMIIQLIDVGTTLIIELVNGFSGALPPLIPKIIDAALTLINALTNPEVLVSLINAATILITELSIGITEALPLLLEQAPYIIKNIMQALSESAPLLLESAFEIVLILAEAIIDNLPLIVESAAGLIAEFGMGIENFVGSLWEKGKSIVSEVGEGVKFAVDAAKTWAKDLIDNFVQGIKDNIYKIKEKASEMAQTVKDFIGFSEPEKGPLSNFHTYAPDMIDLYTQGIDSNQHRLIDSMRGMAANVRNSLDINANSPDFAFSSAGNAGTISGGIVQNISVNLSIEGSNTIEDIDTITDRAVEQTAYKLRMLEISNKRALGGTGW